MLSKDQVGMIKVKPHGERRAAFSQGGGEYIQRVEKYKNRRFIRRRTLYPAPFAGGWHQRGLSVKRGQGCFSGAARQLWDNITLFYD